MTKKKSSAGGRVIFNVSPEQDEAITRMAEAMNLTKTQLQHAALGVLFMAHGDAYPRNDRKPGNPAWKKTA